MRSLGSLFGIAASAAVLPGCDKPPVSSTPRPEAPVPVTVARAVREDVPVQVRAIGWIEAFSTVTVRPQVSGRVEQVHFAEGQDITQGDELFTIDHRPFLAALRLAEANLARDEAAAELARRENVRVEDLLANGQASERERDQAQADATGRAAQVRADEAQVEQARLDLDYCTIRSTLSGRAGEFLVDPGNVVEANKTDLVVINQIHPIYVTFSVPERYSGALQRGLAQGDLSVEVRSDDAPDADPAEPWRLTFIDNQVDKTTGMMRAKATFPNDDRRHWPGRFVHVLLTTARLRDAVVVPATAVQPGQSAAFVYVVRPDETVEPRNVETGYAAGGRIVITTGLNGDETVVTDGQLRLTPGARIKAKNASAANPATMPDGSGATESATGRAGGAPR